MPRFRVVGIIFIFVLLLSALVWWRSRPGKETEGVRPAATVAASSAKNVPDLVTSSAGAPTNPLASTVLASVPPDWRSSYDRLAYAQRWESAAQPSELIAFREWTDRFRATTDPLERAALEPEGVALARARRPIMLAMIERDPRRALAMTVPAAVRETLPPAVVAELEMRVAGTGNYAVIMTEAPDRLSLPTVAVAAAGGASAPRPGDLQRFVSLGGDYFRAHVYGRRRAEDSKDGASIHGIALDGHLALHEEPLRLVEAGESLARGVESIDPLTAGNAAPAGAQSPAVDNGPSFVEFHGRLWALAVPDDLLELQKILRGQEARPGPRVVLFEPGAAGSSRILEAQATPWTTGTKKVLVIRVDFPDVAGVPLLSNTQVPITVTYAHSLINDSVRPFYETQSYGKTSITPTVSDQVYRLPDTAASYATSGNTVKLHDDARAAASANYIVSEYDFVQVVFSYIGPQRISGSQFTFGGIAWRGGSQSLINGSFDFRVVAHELGHNYGLAHANFWQGTFGDPYSSNGSTLEYGDPFDIMGGINTTVDARHHFNPWFKNRLGWLPDAGVITATTSGTYRINRYDTAGAPLDQPLALNIFRDGCRSYWVGQRRSFTNNASLMAGAYVTWGFYSNRQSQLLNTSGSSFSTDAGLVSGRPLNDPSNGVTIRTAFVALDWIDLDVTIAPSVRNIVGHWGEDDATLVPPGLNDVVQIAAGDEHGIALKRDGTVVVWGDKDPEGPNQFGEVVLPAGLNGNVASVAAGGDVSGVIKKDGTILAWGLADDGQTAVPAGLNNVVQLAFGGDQSIALKGDGTVVAWGNNDRGQIAVPAGLIGVKAISAGRGLSLALLNDGTVLHWGINADQKPADLTNVVAIAAGWGHALALRADGTVVAWGDNLSGECNVPTGLTDVKQIGAGDDHSVALKTDGTIVAWGDDSFEQVTIPRGLPRGIEAVAVGENHTMALLRGTNAPIITTQPQGMTLSAESSTFFSVAVASPSPATYRWQFRSTQSDLWTDVLDGSGISGATTERLSIASAAPSMTGEYRCSVTNGSGYVVTSSPALLTVVVPQIVLSSNPTNQQAVSGQSAYFSVGAGGPYNMTIRWQRQAAGTTGWVDLTANATYPIVNATSLTINAVSYAMNGDQFRCALAAGSYTTPVTSAAATLTVSPKPLVVSVSPLDAEATTGQSAAFSVEATGEGPVTYRWQRKSVASDAVWSDLANGSTISGVAASSLVISGVAFANNNDQFRCIVGDLTTRTTMSNAAVLRIVLVPAVMITSPNALFAVTGGAATLTAPAHGLAGALTYQWRKDSVAITGAVGPSFSLTNLKADDAAFYDVVISDTTGSAISEPTRLDVSPATFPNVLRVNRSFAPVFERIGGSVVAAAAAPDGGTYIVGDFGIVSGKPRRSLAKLRGDGSLDPSFVAPAITSGAIRFLAVQSDGRVIAAGDFTGVGGLPQNRIARFLHDGSPDPSFNAGTGFDSTVSSVVIQTDGKILVGGSFLKCAGVDRKFLARLNPDGSIDSTYILGSYVNAAIAGMALQTDGKLLVPATVTSASYINGLIRLQPDGSLDTSFSTNNVAPYPYRLVAVQADGKILLSRQNNNMLTRLLADGNVDTSFTGSFVTAGDVSNFIVQGSKILVAQVGNPFIPAVISRLESNGRPDPTFTTLRAGANFSAIYAFAPSSGNSVVFAGSFRSLLNSAHANIARLLDSGAIDEGFTPTVGLAGEVSCVVPAKDGRWMVGGTFDYVSGVPRGNLARLNADGTVDRSFSGTPGADSTVETITRTPNAKWAIGGAFTTYNGIARSRIALLGDDGALDTSFVPEQINALNNFDVVSTLLPTGFGRLLAGGNFYYGSGTTRNDIVRYNPNGSIDGTLRLGTGSSGRIRRIAPLPDGKFLAAGIFARFDGSETHDVVRLNPDGSRDASFQRGTLPGAGGPSDADLVCSVRDPVNRLVVGGWFSTFDGVARGSIARLGESGTLDTTFAANGGFNQGVTALSTQADGWLLAGGRFTSFDGVASPHIARLGVEGGIDTTFQIKSLKYSSLTKVRALVYRSDGALLAAGTSFDFGDFEGGGLVLLESAGPPPTMLRDPESSTVDAGDSVTLEATASSPGAVSYQWQMNGANIAGATSSNLVLRSAQLFHAGSYSVLVSNDGGAVKSATAVISVRLPTTSSSRLLNLSTRGLSLTGNDVLIPGFVVSGSANKRLLMRVVGPALAQFGVAGTLPNPRMTLKRYVNDAYQNFAANDNWGSNSNATEIASASASMFAFPLGATSTDAALLLDVPPGQYTIIGDDASGGTGVAIVELYDADETNPSAPPLAGRSRLSNISNRGFVGTGGNIMIPGFVVSSEGAKTLLVRAVGPGLTQFGVGGVLADPQLTIYFRPLNGGADTQILSQDNWGDNPDAAHTASVASQVFAFPLTSGSKDAAFVVTLQPGIYTVHASGVGGTTGVALVEIYEVQ